MDIGMSKNMSWKKVVNIKNRTAFSVGAYTAWKKAKKYGWIDEIEWATR